MGSGVARHVLGINKSLRGYFPEDIVKAEFTWWWIQVPFGCSVLCIMVRSARILQSDDVLAPDPVSVREV